MYNYFSFWRLLKLVASQLSLSTFSKLENFKIIPPDADQIQCQSDRAMPDCEIAIGSYQNRLLQRPDFKVDTATTILECIDKICFTFSIIFYCLSNYRLIIWIRIFEVFLYWSCLIIGLCIILNIFYVDQINVILCLPAHPSLLHLYSW